MGTWSGRDPPCHGAIIAEASAANNRAALSAERALDSTLTAVSSLHIMGRMYRKGGLVAET